MHRVRTDGGVSEGFVTKMGLSEGDPLSNVSFNLALEEVMQKGNTDKMGLITKGDTKS